MQAWQRGDRCWVAGLRTAGEVIEATTLWGQTRFRVWLPERDAIVSVGGEDLAPIDDASPGADRLMYLAAAARIADALAENVLLAPMQSNVTPLPHQLYALQRATRAERVRFLLADEVGLGKTIEAGLIIRELKLRGLVRRVLVVAPKGLTPQWQAEMRLHFSEDFRVLSPSDFPAMRHVLGEQDNFWRSADQVICSLDSVKPMESRRGWKAEDVADYNRERFDDLVSAGWDLVIIDEAHRMAGANAQVARHKLGAALSEASPYLLLLSATPHQGKSDAFHRLLTLLDREAFPDEASVTRERVATYVIRTEKRAAIDASGAALFKPRQTRLTPVAWADRHAKQRTLYEAVTAYVRHGYNQSLKTKQRHIGFLMILMQRLVTSSTSAIRTTLERRLEALRQPIGQLNGPLNGQLNGQQTGLFDEETWLELDGESQVSTVIDMAGWRDELAEVETLLDMARITEAGASDAKAEALLDLIYRLQQEEQEPDLKVLVFTEFVPTQKMLCEFLSQRGISVAVLNGGMGLEQRVAAQKAFASDVRALVSTDAGGEGLNLQFCHVIVNFDMPWNPMRVEQRIGRVDRIGQAKLVRAVNFVLEDTVEHRVRDVLEHKLAVIAEEFGIDKAADVMDSVEAEALFDDLYVRSLADPSTIAAQCDQTLENIRLQMASARNDRAILPSNEHLAPDEARALMEHPLQVWLERAVVYYLRDQAAAGASAEHREDGWWLHWPQGQFNGQADGRTDEGVVFGTGSAGARKNTLTLEDGRLRGLIAALPHWAEGLPVPCVRIAGLPASVMGVWSLWQIGLSSDAGHGAAPPKRRFLPVFMSDEGRVFMPTARRVWDLLLTETLAVPTRLLKGTDALGAYAAARSAALQHGEQRFNEMAAEHQLSMTREAERMDDAFAARRRLIDRVGLPGVRKRRLALLEAETGAWRQKASSEMQTTPTLTAICMLRVGD